MNIANIIYIDLNRSLVLNLKKLKGLKMNKKSLLSAVLLAILTFPSMGFAGEWTTDIQGNIDVLYGYGDVDSDFSSQNGGSQATSSGNAEFSAKYEFNNDYQVELSLDVMAALDKELEDYNQGKWGEEAYITLDTPIGRFMAGQTFNVAAQFHVGAPDIGVFGVENSDVVDFLRNPNWQRNSHGTKFATLNTTYINTDGVAPKISYISPQYYGTMLGLSYVPESYNRRGLINKFAEYKDNAGYIAALYNQTDLGFADMTTSLGYAVFEDIDKEYSAGISLYRAGWTLGAAYRRTDAETDKAPLDKKVNEATPEFFDGYRAGYAWDVGLSYEIGPYEVSLGYFKSKADKSDNSDEIIMLSNKYSLNKNVDIYLVAAHVDFSGSSSAEIDNNRGYAFMTGFSLNF